MPGDGRDAQWILRLAGPPAVDALWTDEDWGYLAVILDLASRRVVGWAVRPTLETDLVLAALHLRWGGDAFVPACCITPTAGASTPVRAISRPWRPTGSAPA